MNRITGFISTSIFNHQITTINQQRLGTSSFSSPTNNRNNLKRKYITKQTNQSARMLLNDDDDDDDDGFDDDDDEISKIYHESWDIYSKPGNLCVVCLGTGYSKCLYCFGKGTVRIGPDIDRDTIVCPQCNGLKKEMCYRCEGTGIRPSFKYALSEDGEIIKVPNLTNEQINNLPAYNQTEAYQKDLERERIEKEEKEKEESETETEEEIKTN